MTPFQKIHAATFTPLSGDSRSSSPVPFLKEKKKDDIKVSGTTQDTLESWEYLSINEHAEIPKTTSQIISNVKHVSTSDN